MEIGQMVKVVRIRDNRNVLTINASGLTTKGAFNQDLNSQIGESGKIIDKNYPECGVINYVATSQSDTNFYGFFDDELEELTDA